ncbi:MULTISPECIES: MocR-like pyridoxine biosynthesis transcription factor PdxR [Paenibacillus]|uniref:MocR-like pyridoxine biosynthesis transcription factor PdxR n=1 Tax=Paenibacillus TaxID=44249 RepID=UPI00073F16EF|nr:MULTISPECIES: PLP-dependent aminotransferase family protein [Paenibacillus]MDU4694898.1 PLP-dependent aminotransferase family protein [Paenibacillus sp.]
MYILPPHNDERAPQTGRTYRYVEIYESFKQEIIAGSFQEEQRLPSIRKLAEFLGISTTPVELAYQQLIAEGFIESRPKRGYFVVKLPEPYQALELSGKKPGRELLPEPALQKAHPAPDAESTEVPLYDFHLSKNDFSLFPFTTWKKLHNPLFRPESADLLFYGDAQGDPGLRREIAGYLNRFRGVHASPDRIVIGAEQHLLLLLLGQMLKGEIHSVAVEEPGYRIVPAALAALDFTVHPIPLDKHGLRPDLLRTSGARIASVSPSHQFPTGLVMPLSRRLELLEWAQAVDGYLIEDDYGGEFRYQGKPVPALQGLVPNDRVIYLGGFSQVLLPDICIHYLVLPEHLVARFHALRRHTLFEASASGIHQRTLQRFMQEGHFERHIRRMRNLYRKKNRQLVASLAFHFGERAAVTGDSAGLHVILSLRSRLPEAQLLQMARQAGVRIASAAFFWNAPPETEQKSFMLGFGGIAAEQIDEGVARLHQAWSPYLQ